MNKETKQKKSAKKIINLMVANELAFSRLYKKYSALFPNVEFWLDLSKEEVRHAQWLKALFDSSDTIIHNRNLLMPEAVEIINRAVEAEIKSDNELSLPLALKKSLRFERMFIEKNYFAIFAESSNILSGVMEKLKAETLHHITMIEIELNRVQE